MNKLLAIFLSALSFSSFAAIKDITTLPFGMVGEEQTAITYFNMDDGRTWRNIVNIGVSKGGEQKVYFTRILEEGSYCTLKGNKTDTEQQVWTIAGQNVRMNIYCGEFSGSPGEYFQTSYATSAAGENFIVNQFKKAKSTVYVEEAGGFSVNYSAKGFTKAWNTAGGNAL